MTLWMLSSKPCELTAGGWSTDCALCGTSSRGDAQAAEDVTAVSKVRVVLLEWDEALWKAHEDAAAVQVVRRSSRGSWLPPRPTFSETAPPSRGRGPGRARLRRKLRRPSC
jgi:hypothetical protein